MPSAPPLLRKCAEIFLVESTKLLIYKCFICLDWFSSHSECQAHVQGKCPGPSAPAELIATTTPKEEPKINDIGPDDEERLSDIIDEEPQETQKLGKIWFKQYVFFRTNCRIY